MASRGVNKVILIGNLGADPEVRYMPNGGQVTTIRLATSESWKDQSGQPQERTEWHRVVFYRRLAEIAGEYLKKGSKVYLEGSLRTQQWEKNGEKRYTTEIIAHELQMLDRAGGNGEAGGNESDDDRPRQPQHRQAHPHPPQSARQHAPREPAMGGGGGHSGEFEGDEPFDDDIPFAFSLCRVFRKPALKTGLVSFVEKPIF